jgi:hypothetical protein
LGFLSTAALAAKIERGHVTIAETTTGLAGYAITSNALRWQPLLRSITQIAIVPGQQRRHTAAALIAQQVAAANADSQVGIQAICRADLDANQFWKCLHFVPICYLTPDTARRQPLIVWRLPLVTEIPLWFAAPPDRAGHHGSRPTPPKRKGVFHEQHNTARWSFPHPNAPYIPKQET